jgi:kumamolisin
MASGSFAMIAPPEPRVIGPVDPDEPMTVTVIVRRRHLAPTESEIEAQALKPISERKYPTREVFATDLGADSSDLETVAAFARHHGLNVSESDPARRQVILSGRASSFALAFGVMLQRFHGPSGEYRGTTDEIRIPSELHPAVESILGLDDRPAARPRE